LDDRRQKINIARYSCKIWKVKKIHTHAIVPEGLVSEK
jgi:hypothetical protein